MVLALGRAQGISGWMNDRELAWLAMRAARAYTIIEVGSYRGRSTRALADHCPGTVYAVDPWADGAVRRAFGENLADHIAAGRVRPCPTTFAAAAAGALQGVRADLVFIDDDHDYAPLVRHIALARRLLKKPGGVLAGHDYGQRKFPAVARAVNEAFGAAAVSRCSTIWWVVPA